MPNYYGAYPANYFQQPQFQQQAQIQNVQSQQQTQIQNGGFMPAPNEAYAFNYPVAPGNCITFKVEGQPIVIEKSMGFSQLESPKVDRYRLVKEDVVETQETPQNDSFDPKPILTSIDDIKAEIGSIWSEIEVIKNDHKPESTTKKTTKRDKDGDD